MASKRAKRWGAVGAVVALLVAAGAWWLVRRPGPPTEETLVRFYAPAPVSVHSREDVLHTLTDGLVGKALKVPTLFELADVRAFVSLGHVYRGADLLTTPEPGTAADLLVDFARGLVGAPDVERETYAELDRKSVAHLLEAFEQRGIPRLQVVYFHVLFVSDHGHTPVLGDDRHALSAQGDDEPTTVLERAGFRLRPLKLEVEPRERDFQAVVAYQGAMAYVYLADRSTCPKPGQRCDWSRPPGGRRTCCRWRGPSIART